MEKETFINMILLFLPHFKTGVTHIFGTFSLLCYAQAYKLALAAFTVASHRHIQVGLWSRGELFSSFMNI